MAANNNKCPTCQEDVKNPKLLPCGHLFCLECLEDSCRDRLPEDVVPCPICGNEFEVPENGLAGLPFGEQDKESTSDACEASSTDQSNTPATVDCRDCSGIPCKKMRGEVGERHEVARREPDSGGYCEKHEDERIEMYCLDCGINMCAICFTNEHKYHKIERIEQVADEFARSIDDEIEQVTSRIECYCDAISQFETENNKTLDNIKAIEFEVKMRSKEMKELVDCQERGLLDELQSLKSAAETEVKSYTDALQLLVTEMESFRTSLLELRLNGSASDITQAVNDVHDRANELLQTYVIPSEYHAPSYKFTSVNIDELLRDDQNLIGHVKTQRAGDLGQAASVITEIKTDSYVIGVTSVDDELFLLLDRDDDQVAVYSINDYQLLRHLNLPEVNSNDLSDMTSCNRQRCLYISDSKLYCIHRYHLASGTMSMWLVLGSPCRVSVTPSCNLLVTCTEEPGMLVELSGYNGQWLREIELQCDIECTQHSVKLTSGQYVVCHGKVTGDPELHQDSDNDDTSSMDKHQGTEGSALRRVCIVGDDGKVIHSYGGSDVGQLCRPCHLAVDTDSQLILVADRDSNKVVLLTPSCEFVRCVHDGLSAPHRLYLHESTRRLFVAHCYSIVVVIQL